MRYINLDELFSFFKNPHAKMPKSLLDLMNSATHVQCEGFDTIFLDLESVRKNFGEEVARKLQESNSHEPERAGRWYCAPTLRYGFTDRYLIYDLEGNFIAEARSKS